MRILLAAGLLLGIASAQTPDAGPLASPSAAEAKQSVPPPSPKNEVPHVAAPSKPEKFCYAPATGLFTVHVQPKSTEGEVHNYLQLLMSQTLRDWGNLLTGSDRLAAMHGHIPAVRFVINADGSHSAPEITMSSGNDSLDAKALATIRKHLVFDPPPKDVTKPFAVCMRYSYGVTLDTLDPFYYDRWQKP